VNPSLGNLLISLAIEHNNHWDQILPQVESSYKDSPNRSTSKSPFQIVYGMHPRGISELIGLGRDEFQSTRVEEFAAEMKKLHGQIKGQL